jgi:hypothetical protein
MQRSRICLHSQTRMNVKVRLRVTHRPVPESSGQILLIRICFSPYSAARPFVAFSNINKQPSTFTEETYIRNSSFTSIIPNQSWSWSSSAGRSNVDDASALPLIDQVGNNMTN